MAKLLYLFMSGLLAQASSPELTALQKEYTQLHAIYSRSKAKYDALTAQLAQSRARAVHLPFACNGRLTTQNNTPVSTGNRTAQPTLYFTPYKGNRISLFRGGRWQHQSFTQASLSLGSGLSTDTNYDVFAYNTGSSVAIEFSAGWANDSTRTEALTKQDGVWVKGADPSRLYIGTIRTETATTTADAATARLVWNYYNRIPTLFYFTDLTNTWTYNGTAWRQSNSNVANAFPFVIGLPEALVRVRVHGVAGTAAALTWTSHGIGLDSTTINSAQLMGSAANPSLGTSSDAEYAVYPAAGFHQLYWLETTDGANTVTFWGDNGNTKVRTGMEGWLEG